jgi:hypothetical protein
MMRSSRSRSCLTMNTYSRSYFWRATHVAVHARSSFSLSFLSFRNSRIAAFSSASSASSAASSGFNSGLTWSRLNESSTRFRLKHKLATESPDREKRRPCTVNERSLTTHTSRASMTSCADREHSCSTRSHALGPERLMEWAEPLGLCDDCASM